MKKILGMLSVFLRIAFVLCFVLGFVLPVTEGVPENGRFMFMNINLPFSGTPSVTGKTNPRTKQRTKAILKKTDNIPNIFFILLSPLLHY